MRFILMLTMALLVSACSQNRYQSHPAAGYYKPTAARGGVIVRTIKQESPERNPIQMVPIRSAWHGSCDCPYDYTRRGRRCGGRSAYSRPGGRSPVCYKPAESL